MQTETLVRHLVLSGPGNFRDLGGYRTNDGRVTRWRRLFRSDSLHHLTSDDIDSLQREGIEIKLGLDLRTERELKAAGHGELFERGARHLHVAFVPEVQPADPERQLEEIVELYLHMIERSHTCVKTVFDALVSPDNYPIAYYCAAGKDRTGILTALILLSLGVSEDEVVADYSMTDEHMHGILSGRVERARLERQRREASGAGPHEPGLAFRELPAQMLRARPETMRAFLTRLDARYGSALGFLHDCGVGARILSGIRAQLLDE